MLLLFLRKKMSKAKLSLSFCLLAFILSSCARDISSNNYTAYSVGEACTTLSGVIQNVREVSVNAHDELGQNSTGILAGGLGGGALGSSVGRGNFLPTALGATVGAIGGSLIEKKLKQQTALEYIIALDDGNLMAVVQGKDVILPKGQSVYLIVGLNGRSRLVAK